MRAEDLIGGVLPSADHVRVHQRRDGERARRIELERAEQVLELGLGDARGGAAARRPDVGLGAGARAGEAVDVEIDAAPAVGRRRPRRDRAEQLERERVRGVGLRGLGEGLLGADRVACARVEDAGA